MSKATVNINHLVILANLTLTENERKFLEKQLEETLDYVQKLNKVNTKGVEPTSQVTNLENVLRDDITRPSLSQKDALKNAKSTYQGFILTDAILEDK